MAVPGPVGNPKDRISRDAAHCVIRKLTFWFLNWSDTNQAVQLQKMTRGLKFRIWKVEGSYYLCSENKGVDQLRGYREADLRLCFRIRKTLVFSLRGSFDVLMFSLHSATVVFKKERFWTTVCSDVLRDINSTAVPEVCPARLYLDPHVQGSTTTQPMTTSEANFTTRYVEMTTQTTPTSNNFQCNCQCNCSVSCP